MGLGYWTEPTCSSFGVYEPPWVCLIRTELLEITPPHTTPDTATCFLCLFRSVRGESPHRQFDRPGSEGRVRFALRRHASAETSSPSTRRSSAKTRFFHRPSWARVGVRQKGHPNKRGAKNRAVREVVYRQISSDTAWVSLEGSAS